MLLDPGLGLSQIPETLDTLSLIADKLIIVQPSEENLRNWKYNFEKFDKLVNEGVFVPVFPGGEANPFSNGLRREDLLTDQDFFAYYEQAIQNDLEDDKFFNIAEELRLEPRDLAFNVNWDLIISQRLNSSLISAPNLNSIWQYKFQTSIRDLSKIEALPPEAQNAHILKDFLHRVLDDLPSSLTANQLVQFRKDERSTNFRIWFRKEIEKAANSLETSDNTINDVIYRDFKTLAHGFSRRTGRVSASISALSSLAGAVIGAAIGGIPGAMVGGSASLAPYAFHRALHQVWKKRGPNNWVFVLLEFRSASQL